MVATENDTVYAFDAGKGHQLWSRHLGQPVSASSLPCGDITPVSGITSTPVADPGSGLLYVVGFFAPGRHMLYALDVSSGDVRWSRPADPPSDSPLVQQQRSALALAGGNVYVAYGGLFGDCGSYHGWVVGVPVAGGANGPLLAYRVPCHRECGIWAPTGPAVDSGGDIWVATGNADSTQAFDFGNAVLRLSPDLRLLDWFAPSNWAALSASDQDLGSTSPVLLDGGLVWIAGKEGTGYLLRAGRLGGIGGQAFSARACSSYGGSVYSAPTLYVACSGEVLAVQVTWGPPAFSIRWRRPLAFPGPPLVAAGAVWVIQADTGTLTALSPTDGHPLYNQAGGSAAHFATPTAAGGVVYAALGRRLLAVPTT
jgi:outer membrane protein assembly factor BamB